MFSYSFCNDDNSVATNANAPISFQDESIPDDSVPFGSTISIESASGGSASEPMKTTLTKRVSIEDFNFPELCNFSAPLIDEEQTEFNIVHDSDLSPSDVLFGGNGTTYPNQLGNLRFHQWIGERKESFLAARSRSEQGQVVRQVIQMVQNQVPPGRFLEKNELITTNGWILLGVSDILIEMGKLLGSSSPPPAVIPPQPSPVPQQQSQQPLLAPSQTQHQQELLNNLHQATASASHHAARSNAGTPIAVAHPQAVLPSTGQPTPQAAPQPLGQYRSVTPPQSTNTLVAAGKREHPDAPLVAAPGVQQQRPAKQARTYVNATNPASVPPPLTTTTPSVTLAPNEIPLLFNNQKDAAAMTTAMATLTALPPATPSISSLSRSSSTLDLQQWDIYKKLEQHLTTAVATAANSTTPVQVQVQNSLHPQATLAQHGLVAANGMNTEIAVQQQPGFLNLACPLSYKLNNSPELPKGVTNRRSGKWQAQFYFCGKSRYIGVYPDSEQAATAYRLVEERLTKHRQHYRRPGMQLDKEEASKIWDKARKAAEEAVRSIYKENMKKEEVIKAFEAETKKEHSMATLDDDSK